MTDSERIANSGITSAIIIDDGYDSAPRTEELANEDAWEVLFDDAFGENEAALKEAYGEFDRNEREIMRADQAFVDALWINKDTLGAIVEDLFFSYVEKSTTNSEFLSAAEAALNALDIEYTVHGRDFLAAATAADLILVDLYLGTQQGEDEYQFTVDGLKRAMDMRDQSAPPSIILMSQVALVDQKSKDFRTDVGLHASGFRFIRKNDILQAGHLAGLIITLATHRPDSHALASFLQTWTEKSAEAVQKTGTELRKIDIDDLQHTKSILLSVESTNASSYMLDVFDRVLQNQIEANPDVVEAALALDAIATDPPPLTLAQHKDPFELIERTIYVNLARVRQNTGSCWPITFGDIIALKPGVLPKAHGHFSGKSDLVFFVASPECDLIRDGGLTTVLLMVGRLHPLKVGEKLIDAQGRITPIFVGPDDKRYQIEWDFGHHISLTLKKVRNWLGDLGDGQVAARLRDVTALSLTQRFLGEFGRIAEPAPPPRSFPVNINVFYPARGGGLTELTRPDGSTITGLCLVNKRGNNSNLIIDQNFEPHLFAQITSIEEQSVHRGSLSKISKASEQTNFRELFRVGLNKVGHPINSKIKASIQLRRPEDVDGHPKYDNVIIGTVVMSDDVAATLGGGLSDAGLVFQVSEMLD